MTGGLRLAGYLLIVFAVVVGLGFLGPLNPSCGSGFWSWLFPFLGVCQSYAPYAGIGMGLVGIILIAFSKEDE